MNIPPQKIKSWVIKNFPDYKTRKGGLEIRINSPFTHDTGYKFNISVTKGKCHDWRGDDWAGYDPHTGKRLYASFLRFVQKYLTLKRGHCSFAEAVRDVFESVVDASIYLRSFKLQDAPAKTVEHLVLPPASESFDGSDKVKAAVLNWLAGRGIDAAKVAKYKMQHSMFNVVWPYYEYDELVYWQTRSILNKKFNFPPEDIGVGKSEFFYGFDLVQPREPVVLTEAIIDAQTVDDQSMATGGVDLSPLQLKKLKLLSPSAVILAPDNDGAGIKSVLVNAPKLVETGYRVYVSVPPKLELGDGFTKDWNDVGKVVGWGGVRSVLESRIEPYNLRVRMALRQLL